jgi:hypothetical protein
MKRTLTVAALALVAIACLSVAAYAQTGPTGPTTDPKPTTTTGLSEQDLEAAIKALDPNFKVYPTNDGKGKIYTLKIVRDGWTYDLKIESFEQVIWLNANLSGEIASLQNLPATALADLIKHQLQIGPMHFAFVKTQNGHRLNLCYQMGRQMSVDVFNNAMNTFLKSIKDTYPTWSQIR